MSTTQPSTGRHAQATPADEGDAGAAPATVWSQIRRPQLTVALGLITLFTGFRAWSLYPSWFYGDDFILIETGSHGLSAGYLFEPHSIHLMPVGRFIAYLAAENGGLNWTFVATSTLLLQLAVALACWWMLRTLFGERWGTVGLLALFLSSAIALPATMWWAAAINQLPHQLALCLAVGSWVNYCRSRSWWWLIASLAAVSFGLLSYVKSALILPLLALILVAYFTSGSPRERLREASRRHWQALVLFTSLGCGFILAFVRLVPDVSASQVDIKASSLVDTMIVESVGSGLLGGPWRWSDINPPTSIADPPMWGAVLAWLSLFAVAAYLFLTRSRTLRAWAVFAAFTVGSFLLLFFSRASGYGEIAGLELRYSTDLALVFPLCLGLASMRLIGAPEASTGRTSPLLTFAAGPRTTISCIAVVAALGLWSSGQYVLPWHSDNPARDYSDTLRAEVEPNDELADRPLSPFIFSADMRLSTLTAQLDLDVTYPEISTRLLFVDDAGNVLRPLIEPVTVAQDGPRDGCGWPVSGAVTTTIPMESEAGAWDWWARLGVLSSQETRLSVTINDDTLEANVPPGVSSVYVHVLGSVDSIRVRAASPDASVCVDDVEVGNLVGGQPR